MRKDNICNWWMPIPDGKNCLKCDKIDRRFYKHRKLMEIAILRSITTEGNKNEL